jgi:hypothetical protein
VATIPGRIKTMLCLFCRSDTGGNKSIEHIIPESLGNIDHTLPVGIVCDNCNNYFSREVEKPFLEIPAIVDLRFTRAVPNKQGRFPKITGVLLPNYLGVLNRDKVNRQLSIELPSDAINQVQAHGKGTLILPFPPDLTDGPVVSRFIGKVAVEFLALKTLMLPDAPNFLDHLDLIKNHARRGTTPKWPVSIRKIYDADAAWVDEEGTVIEIVHECNIYQIRPGAFYFVLAIFGMEFAINYLGPDIDSYKEWLSRNHGVSPLYFGKDNSGFPRRIGK